MDRGAWWATVHGVAKSRTRLGDSSTTTIMVCVKTDSVSLYWPVMITGAALGLLSSSALLTTTLGFRLMEPRAVPMFQLLS